MSVPPPGLLDDRIPASSDEVEIVAVAADHIVGAGAAGKGVVARTPFEPVVAGAAAEEVCGGDCR